VVRHIYVIRRLKVKHYQVNTFLSVVCTSIKFNLLRCLLWISSVSRKRLYIVHCL